MIRPADSATPTARAKAEPGSPEYQSLVAKPIMEAVDGMPPAYRTLVHDLGYVGVYRAWKKGWTVAMIQRVADLNGGRFEL